MIAVMSDRACTLAKLTNSVVARNLSCSVVIANHSKGKGVLDEHGPFAGAGFFQDLAFSVYVAREAVVGTLQPPQHDSWRTSSQLLEELVEYTRVMEDWQLGDSRNTNKLKELIRCGVEIRF
jgi:hypothetical protein